MKCWLSILLMIGGWNLFTTEVELAVGMVDRIEGEKAVILLEKMQEELLAEKQLLGVPARKGSWLLIDLRNRQPRVVKELPQLERVHKQKSKELLEKLRRKNY